MEKKQQLFDSLPKRRLMIFVGAYGSGKTEVAVNYTLWLASLQQKRVQMADLDIVNPYFRCREARELLISRGVEVFFPQGEQFYSELPIILPQIRGLIQHNEHWAVFDVGGDDHGARVLHHLRHFFDPDAYDLWLVLNGNRPFTDTKEGALQLMSEVQMASGLSLTGLIGNTHLMEYSTPETILEGYALLREVSQKSGLPIEFVAVERSLYQPELFSVIRSPIFPIDRIMSPPWIAPAVRPGKPIGVP